jgi:uncharacterized protein
MNAPQILATARGATPLVLSIRNQTRETVLCSRGCLATNWHGRARGLLGRSKLTADEGMVFEAGSLVPLMWMHTFFMRFPIDIIFLGRDNAVMKIDASLQPWRLSAIAFGARTAIELCEGAAARTKTEIGDFISIARNETSI